MRQPPRRLGEMCKHGHVLTAATTWTSPVTGHLRCRICANLQREAVRRKAGHVSRDDYLAAVARVGPRRPRVYRSRPPKPVPPLPSVAEAIISAVAGLYEVPRLSITSRVLNEAGYVVKKEPLLVEARALVIRLLHEAGYRMCEIERLVVRDHSTCFHHLHRPLTPGAQECLDDLRAQLRGSTMATPARQAVGRWR